MKPPDKYSLILLLFLVMQTVYCWYCFSQARYKPYDDNYGLLLHALIISLFTAVIVLFLWLRKKRWIRKDRWIPGLWLIIGSPLPLFFAFLFYRYLFGELATY